jgi:hypothetical protein
VKFSKISEFRKFTATLILSKTTKIYISKSFILKPTTMKRKIACLISVSAIGIASLLPGAINGQDTYAEAESVTQHRRARVVFPLSFCSQNPVPPDALRPEHLPANYSWPVVIGGCGGVTVRYQDNVHHLPGHRQRIIRKWEVCDPCSVPKGASPSCDVHIQVIESEVVPGATATAGNDPQAAGIFELYQNKPNPFSTETLIGFTLPEAAPILLAIQDVNGRVLQVIEGEYPAGYSEVSFSVVDLPVLGMLFYTLTTPTDRATLRMVVTW